MRGDPGDCSPVVGDGGDDSQDGVEKGVLDDSWDDTMPGWVTIPGLCGSLGSSSMCEGPGRNMGRIGSSLVHWVR